MTASKAGRATLTRCVNLHYTVGVKRRLSTALAVGLLACLALAATTYANRAPKLFVIRSIVSSQVLFRPHTIGLSADGTFSLEHIRWQSYGGGVARATASAYTRGCTPNCAEGHVELLRAKLRFATPTLCQGRYIYSRLHYVLLGLPQGKRIPNGQFQEHWISIRPAAPEAEKPKC